MDHRTLVPFHFCKYDSVGEWWVSFNIVFKILFYFLLTFGGGFLID